MCPHDPIAQSEERGAVNSEVVGSKPTGVVMYSLFKRDYIHDYLENGTVQGGMLGSTVSMCAILIP